MTELADFWVCPRLDLMMWPIFQMLGAVEGTCSVCLFAVVRQGSVPAGIIGPDTKVICLECMTAMVAEADPDPEESLLSDF